MLIAETTAKHVSREKHDDDDDYNYDDDGAYDELIDISKPTKAGRRARRLVFCLATV